MWVSETQYRRARLRGSRACHGTAILASVTGAPLPCACRATSFAAAARRRSARAAGNAGGTRAEREAGESCAAKAGGAAAGEGLHDHVTCTGKLRGTGGEWGQNLITHSRFRHPLPLRARATISFTDRQHSRYRQGRFRSKNLGLERQRSMSSLGIFLCPTRQSRSWIRVIIRQS